MIDVAIVSFSQLPSVRRDSEHYEIELLLPVIGDVLGKLGLSVQDMGFTCSGSSDFIAGQPFQFVHGLEAIGAWPPIRESHVEADGAWALYEAWTRLQHGDIDTALVYAFGKSSMGDLPEVLALQLDPYLVTPLWPDSVSIAGLQARALLESGKHTEREMAEVAARSRRDALNNPNAHVKGDFDVGALLTEPYFANPLRKHDCPPISDSAAAVVLAAGERARELCARPAWIRGIDHRIEPQALGVRDLTVSPSTARAAEGAGATGSFDVVELHAPFTHQELILRDALALTNGAAINPSGGALAANPMMVAGLLRIGEAAQRIMDGSAGRALAHATSGPCLQQNLVCVIEGAA
jgi:acetyl-CoA acetyltransferase